MRQLLIVSYYFPPVGGTPVRRVLRFARHLPALGWRCSILTAERPYDAFHPTDTEQLGALPPFERVVRAPARDTAERIYARGLDAMRALHGLRRRTAHSRESVAAGGGLRRLLHETLSFPDPKRSWIRPAVRRGVSALRDAPIDAVLGTGYPWSAFVVATRVGDALGVPVILDYRDAWTLNPRPLWTGPRNRRLERALRSAYPELGTTPVLTVPNGYDAAEFPEPDPALREPGRLVLTYTGTFNDVLPPSRYDRTPYFLIRAVEGLEPAVRERLRIRLVGPLGPRYRERRGRPSLDRVRQPACGRRRHRQAAGVRRRRSSGVGTRAAGRGRDAGTQPRAGMGRAARGRERNRGETAGPPGALGARQARAHAIGTARPHGAGKRGQAGRLAARRDLERDASTRAAG
jgi:hypothetical protein